MRIFYLLVLVLFVSCSTNIIRIYPELKHDVIIEKDTSMSKSYSLNQVKNASIGEPIFSVKTLKSSSTYVAESKDVYEVLFDYQSPGIGVESHKFNFKKGDYFDIYGITDRGMLLYSDKLKGIFRYFVLEINHIGNSIGFLFKNSGVSPIQGTWIDKQLFKKTKNVKKKDHEIQYNTYKVEVLYIGKINNNIKAIYREYKDNTARPAFAHELNYNLDESNIISYKTIKIEVLNATNSNIEFKVIEDDGLKWLF